MKQFKDFAERRLYERTIARNLIVGILNPDEHLIMGLINDISLGGVKYSHELTMASYNNPIHSIDLISEKLHINNLPCERAWKVILETESHSKLTSIMQYGIKFSRLTQNQIFLLRDFIDRCEYLETRCLISNSHMALS